MELYEKLKLLREEEGLNQEEMAKKLKIGVSTYKNYESPKTKRIPDTTILKLIKNFFNVSYEYLLEDDIENRTIETIDIQKKIGLNEMSIEVIKKINEENEKLFNDFIIKIDWHLLLKLFSIIITNKKELKNIYNGTKIFELKDLILHYIDTKNLNKLLEILQYFNKNKYLDFEDIGLILYVYNEEEFTNIAKKLYGEDDGIRDTYLGHLQGMYKENEITKDNFFNHLSRKSYSTYVEAIGYSKYVANNILGSYMSKIEDFDSWSDLYNLKDETEFKNFLKDQKHINKSKNK